MTELVVSAIQSFFSHPEFLVPTMWVAFGCVLAWFLLSAKRHHTIEDDELEMLWKSHKQFNHCNATRFEPITKGTQTIGYICECGHQHIQHRPLINFGV
jgi:hypothetical protein